MSKITSFTRQSYWFAALPELFLALGLAVLVAGGAFTITKVGALPGEAFVLVMAVITMLLYVGVLAFLKVCDRRPLR